jgi:REP element-mobilizing transposase RayT
VGGEVELSEVGQIVEACWRSTAAHWPQLRLDVFEVMPNHLHGIIHFADAPNVSNPSPTLGQVMRRFKSLSAVQANRVLQTNGPLWQRGYYDHVVRGDADMDRIRLYILNNPACWGQDPDNPHG